MIVLDSIYFSLTRTQKVLYRVKSGYFATQLKPAAERFFCTCKLGAVQ
ncbi:hypothetical protein CRI64_03360 [Escherichia sp. E2748]|nr:hypothetical protein CI703_11490 [Shigella sonnei]TGB96211.1 hypothetical protein CRI64_03360 [Escherichia sp. E2748]